MLSLGNRVQKVTKLINKNSFSDEPQYVSECNVHSKKIKNESLIKRLIKSNKSTPKEEEVKEPFLNEIQVTDLKSKYAVSDLWREKTTILKVLGSPHCKQCLEEARELHDFVRSELGSDIQLVALISAPIRLSSYFQGGLWDWLLVQDTNNVIAPLLGIGNTNKSKLADLHAKGIPWNLPGTRDSTFVIKKTGRLVASFQGQDFHRDALSCLLSH